ncbi:MAG TPA: hypothetical protein PKN23_00020 [Candidatus Hydrogenedentes bacterium]|nr:hypothetical protein [Candidatus Hydrogenedentota bacterium]HOH49112.1 hypothetical protein [Candidatus Hydrogenedentota bacterium]
MNRHFTTRRGAGLPAALAAFLAVFAVPAAVNAQEYQMHARVSFDSGGILLRASGADEWTQGTVNTLVTPGDTLWVDREGSTELELADLNFLRLADGSKAEIAALPPSANVRGWVGSFYIQRLDRSRGTFQFTTPACAVDISPASVVRVDIDEAGASVVTVRSGFVRVTTSSGGDTTAADGQRVWVDPGMLPSDPLLFDRTLGDAFDQWNTERVGLLEGGMKTIPTAVPVTGTVIGAADLAPYGEWVYVDRRPYWRPTVVVDYVPYRVGYWNHMPAYGHVWVEPYPFAYVTTHYGRWTFNAGYGWLWCYDPVWAPAWVSTVYVRDTFLWAPMDFYGRPVVVGGAATFGVGGFTFCLASTSYMTGTYLTAGYAPVYGVSPVFANRFAGVPVQEVNIWNITVNNYGGGHGGGGGPRPVARPQHRPEDTGTLRVRDYAPQRSIRGVPADLEGKGAGLADRARTLEAGLRRDQFAAQPAAGFRNERSKAPSANAAGPARSVRLASTEARQSLRMPPRTGDAGAVNTRPETKPAAVDRTEGALRGRPDGNARTLTNDTPVPARTADNLRARPAAPDTRPAPVEDAEAARKPAVALRETRTPAAAAEPRPAETKPATRRVALQDMEPTTPAAPRKTEPRTGLRSGTVPDSRAGAPSAGIRDAKPLAAPSQRSLTPYSGGTAPSPTRSTGVTAPRQTAPRTVTPPSSSSRGTVSAPRLSPIQSAPPSSARGTSSFREASPAPSTPPSSSRGMSSTPRLAPIPSRPPSSSSRGTVSAPKLTPIPSAPPSSSSRGISSAPRSSFGSGSSGLGAPSLRNSAPSGGSSSLRGVSPSPSVSSGRAPVSAPSQGRGVSMPRSGVRGR